MCLERQIRRRLVLFFKDQSVSIELVENHRFRIRQVLSSPLFSDADRGNLVKK